MEQFEALQEAVHARNPVAAARAVFALGALWNQLCVGSTEQDLRQGFEQLWL